VNYSNRIRDILETAFTRLFGIDHPVVCAGMGSGISDGDLTGAVSDAGGLGVIGASWLKPEDVAAAAGRVREITDKPFGVNLLLFGNEDLQGAALATQPAVLSTAWPRDDQDLAAIFERAHEHGAKVMHMVTRADDAERAVEAGADVIVAQGSEGGGHVGEMATTVIVRQVVRAVAPVPVLAAGGLEDGAGLAGALALGADGVLLGTRFLASDEAPLPDWLKQAIVASDGYDTIVTTVADTLTGRDWPGAWSRVLRTPFIEQWIGREPELRRRRQEARAVFEALDAEEQPDDWFFWVGQSVGLIDSVEPAGEIVRRIVVEAEEILRSLP
jgi:NAD(P)H-dependent flavin oxidoreductase YrpB (nitropropane dioxygenase family)